MSPIRRAKRQTKHRHSVSRWMRIRRRLKAIYGVPFVSTVRIGSIAEASR